MAVILPLPQRPMTAPTRLRGSTTPVEHPHADLQLPFDLHRLATQTAQRRRTLGWIAGAATWGLVGCGGESSSDSGAVLVNDAAGTASTSTTVSTGTTGTTATTGTSSCTLIPEETAGPYPGDGSNTSGGALANALALSGIVRKDIRASIGSASGVADGVPLSVQLRLVNANGRCARLAGYAIYLWHCDALGRYSMYSSGVTGENHLRGVQVTGSDGTAEFITVFPGCYAGRVPHIHFEVYRSSTTATSFANKLRTSQLALPPAACADVYNNVSLYSASVRNFAAISFASDNVFSDGVTTQLASVTGSRADGYVALLDVGISV
jgi:protocatechuate 3,4-dioxygenase beta subunit